MKKMLLCAMVVFAVAGCASVAFAVSGPSVPAEEPAASTPEPAASPEANALLEDVREVLEGAEGFTLAPAETGAPPARVFEVRECVNLAIAQNGKALSAAADTTAAEAQAGQAKSLLKPEIKAQAAANYYDGLNESIAGSALAQTVLGVSDFSPKKTQMMGQVTVKQVLFAGGSIRAAARASEYLAASAAWKREATLDEIEFEVKQSFYDCLLAKALVEVARDSVGVFERHLADAQHMLDVGVISEFPVLRAKTELGARQSDVESAQTAARIAALNLCRIIGEDQSDAVGLSGKLEWREAGSDVDAEIAEAEKTRPELVALDKAIEGAEAGVAAKRGQYLPKVAASVGYQKTEGMGEMSPDGVTATLGAEWDLYAGGRRKNEIVEAQAKLDSLKFQRVDVARLVEMDVRQAHIRVLDAIAKIRKEKGTVELGREGLRLAELRFQEGVGTQAETLDADLALRQARTGLAKALHEYAIAFASLDRATGHRVRAVDADMAAEQ